MRWANSELLAMIKTFLKYQTFEGMIRLVKPFKMISMSASIAAIKKFIPKNI